MTLGDDVRSIMPELRGAAYSVMVDECVITRAGGPPVLNADTGVLEPPAGTTVYDGPCRLRTPALEESKMLFGDEQVTTTRYILDLPHDTTGVRLGDVVALTTTEDPDAEARPLRIVAWTAETIYVMKTYGCEAVE